ncbi:MAG: hypothetical protein ABIJ96_11945 [Elusimicrobiota bacterium]
MRLLLPTLLLAVVLPARAEEPISFAQAVAATAQTLRAAQQKAREGRILRLTRRWRELLSGAPFNAREWEGGVDNLTYSIRETARCEYRIEAVATSEETAAFISKTDAKVNFSLVEQADLVRLRSADRRPIGVALNLKKETPVRKYAFGSTITVYKSTLEWIGGRRGQPEEPAKLEQLVVVLNGLKSTCAVPADPS